MHNALLNDISNQIILDKVMEDKLKEHEQAQLDEAKMKEEVKVEKIEIDDDDIFGVDENEEKLLEEIKERRLMEQGIKPQARDRSREKKTNKYKYGEYREIEESDFLDTLLKNENVVCHFYHKEFQKCKVMDKHLIQIAFDHPETLFVKINADNSPFFCTKLNIQVLPTTLLSNNGKVFDRIIGFEGLDGEEDFKTITLIRKLVLSKIIKAKNKHESGEIKMTKKTKMNQYDSEDSEN